MSYAILIRHTELSQNSMRAETAVKPRRFSSLFAWVVGTKIFSFPAPIGMRKLFLSHTPEINYEIRSAPPRRIWFDLRKSRVVSVDSVCPLEIVLTKRTTLTDE